eukprot:TRINITY_DN521_c0_g2_i2.p1 TRINITY_DN521_c0_g2~~TRINITY_DN521_c0_g2_i2.p1  ORF type:complete len:357 (+),score=56.59 TRINITY_DN521_c0_g2_i2:62-1132(+)
MAFKGRKASVPLQNTSNSTPSIISTKSRKDSIMWNECTVPANEWDEHSQLRKEIKVFEVNRNRYRVYANSKVGKHLPKFYKPVEKQLSDDSLTNIPDAVLSGDLESEEANARSRNEDAVGRDKSNVITNNGTITIKPLPNKDPLLLNIKPKSCICEKEIQTTNKNIHETAFNINIVPKPKREAKAPPNFTIPFTYPIPVFMCYGSPCYYFPKPQRLHPATARNAVRTSIDPKKLQLSTSQIADVTVTEDGKSSAGKKYLRTAFDQAKRDGRNLKVDEHELYEKNSLRCSIGVGMISINKQEQGVEANNCIKPNANRTRNNSPANETIDKELVFAENLKEATIVLSLIHICRCRRAI